ncbi:MAG: FAD-dependent oxidoreductase [Gemmatimonadota bacterium]
MLPRLLFIGAGPAHLHALRYLARRKTPARETLLVSGAPTIVNPGMLTGFIAGRFRAEEVVIDLGQLAHSAGGELAVGTVASLDPVSRTVRLEDGRTFLYNAASLALEAQPATAGIPGAIRHARYIHSVSQVMSLVPALESTLEQSPDRETRLLVVGSGITAFEIAMALRRQLDVRSRKGAVTIVSGFPTAWGERGAGASLIATALKRNRITLILGARIHEIAEQHLHLSNGARVAFDFLVWAGDGEAPRFLQGAGLPASREGTLLVDPFLQSTGATGLFAAGMTAILAGHPEPEQGFHDPARQGKVLGQNLLRVLEAKSPNRTFDPVDRPFSWATTADDRTILSFGPMATEGHWVSRLKEKQERKNMRRFAHKEG